ncbi:MAG: S8 family serine peptidase [Microcoleaceae cyanobacterium]
MNFESEQFFVIGQELSPEELESNTKVYSEEPIPSELQIENDSSVDEIIVDQGPVRVLNNPSGTIQFSDTVRYAVEQSTKLEEYDAEALAETDEWIVSISATQSVDIIAGQLGVESFDETGIIDNTYVFEFSEQQTAQDITQSLKDVPEIEFFYPLVEEEKFSRFSPNDSLYNKQWHLNNTGQTGGTAGADANVEDAWDTVLGDGVVIGIVDDGVQYTHPDLSGQYKANLSFDFLDNDSDAAPGSGADAHGTSVAGIAAASGNNNIGVSGAAPNADIAGLRLVGAGMTDLKESQTLSHQSQNIDIYNNSWGPFDNGRLGPAGPLTLAALENGVNNGRGGLGNIYVWAAGNGLEANDNTNYDGYANSRYTIAISAIDHNGEQSYYSEPGAPILVAAHSEGDTVGTVTTDLLGSQGYNGLSGNNDYTNDFGGTSSASPLAAGVVALMLDANANLTWRDVQHILVDTAAQNDSSDGDWVTNGGGHLVNHKYGFGAIDADAAVSAALSWTTVDAEETTSAQANVGQTIPDNNATGVSSTISITDDLTIEWVEVVFDADHTYRGDLEITLTSPDGTESILAETRNDPGNNYNNWVFSSARHWDESSLGDWTLTVADQAGQDIGTWNNWQLNVYGTGTTSVNNAVDNDFNGDGRADIHWRDGSDNQIWLMDGNTATTRNNIDSLSSSWTAVGNGDFDADGKADLLYRNGSQLQLWEMNGTTVVDTYTINSLDSSWSIGGIGDTDGDGDDDIVFRNGNANRILEIQNFSDAGLVTLNGYNSAWSIVGMGDTDGDGDDDILFRNNNANRLWEIENNSRVSVNNIGGFNSSWSVSGMGDTDGDGDDDILWRKNNANRLWEIENNSRVSVNNIGGFNAIWQVEDVEDYDGDGDDDILFRNGNRNKLWEMDNNGVVSKTNTNSLNAVWELIG